jgi:D-glycero-D-manno-heptose 1,7-bisphosphate phosphatase
MTATINEQSPKALFLDRDGIINHDHGYVYQKEQFDFVDGIFDLCQKAQQLGYLIIVITNQAGIARGKYSTEQFEQLTEWMVEQFKVQAITITDVYFCPHHPVAGLGKLKLNCHCRKPEPGLLFMAQNQHHIKLEHSIFIGDKVSDMEAAINAGIKKRILVSSKYHNCKNSTDDFIVVDSLINAQKLL